MARLARIVAPGIPHHVTQRGNRRQTVFFGEDGYRAYLAHRRYSRMINFRQGWRGYLWQGRFASCPMHEAHALAAARSIELNPVRAGLAAARRTGAGRAPGRI